MRISRRGERIPQPGSRRGDWLRAGLWGQVLRAVRERARALSNGQFVDDGYRALLERDADPDGRRHYARALRVGSLTREAVVRHLGQSVEAAGMVLERPGFVDHVRRFAGAADAAPPGTRPVCFLHIMKSGGTSLTHSLETLADPWPRLVGVWPDHLVCYPRPMLERAMLVSGHLPFPIRELLPPDVALVTVLREPVSRTLSHLSHLQTFGRRPDVTLEAFVLSDEWRRYWVNYQARQLACEAPIGAAGRGHFPVGTDLQGLIDAPWPGSDADLEDRVRERLDAFEVIGTVEDLDHVLRAVAALWQKPEPPPVGRTNEALVRIRPEDVPPDLLDEIRRHTEVDARLHASIRDAVAG